MRPVIPIADALLQIMERDGERRVHIGAFGLMDEAYALAYGDGHGVRTRPSHPMNRHQAVMDAVRRSPKFKRIGSLRHCYGSGGQERLHPFYEIAEAE